MLISIIIPTCNSDNTLSRCLKSIVEQTYRNFQVWLIDAGSTDNTLQIIRQYQKEYPSINFISEPDSGIYEAMNKGVKLCTGAWVYFMGSDDSFYDNNVLATIADTTSITSDEVIYGNVIMRGENQWNLNNVIFNGEYDLEKLLDVTINHQAIFYKRVVFQKFGSFNLQYKTNADYDFNLRCYASTSFQYINIIIANFFVGGQSTNFPDDEFQLHRGALFYKYFGIRIFNKSFIKSRLYLRRAAFLQASPLTIGARICCLTAYLKLKLQSVFV